MSNAELTEHLLGISRESSHKDVLTGYYPHADRGLREYRELIPHLDAITLSLCRKKSLVNCLDAGCGTSRGVAELENAYPNVLRAFGVTLVYYPPLQNGVSLPRSRILETSVGQANFGSGQFDLILAVGSIDTSSTVVYEGGKLLEFTSKQGVFIFAPTTSTESDADCLELIEHAKAMDFRVEMVHSNYDLPVYYFLNTESD